MHAASFVNNNAVTGAVVGGKNIVLTATDGSIGNSGDSFRLNQFDGGSTSLIAENADVYVYGVGSFNIVELSSGGSVNITALRDIFMNASINHNEEEVKEIFLKTQEGSISGGIVSDTGMLLNVEAEKGIIDLVVEATTGSIVSDNIEAGGNIDIQLIADQLTLESMTGGADVTLTHTGVGDTIAQSTTINNITVPGSVIVDKLYSRNAHIGATVGSELQIVDGKVGTVAPGVLDLNVNDIRTRLDSTNKLRDPSYDFWLWTVDGNYLLTSNSEEVLFPKDTSMRLLEGYGIFMPDNNDTVPHMLANSWYPGKTMSEFNPLGLMRFIDSSTAAINLFPGDDDEEEEEEEEEVLEDDSEEETDILSRVMNDITASR